jgi:5'-nucleotidase/UDP-sugar diphosphatase
MSSRRFIPSIRQFTVRQFTAHTFISIVSMGLVAALLALPSASTLASKPQANASAAPDVRLTILHTNDTHGHLLPYSYPDTYDPTAPIALLKSRHNIGGAARRATLVNRVRQEKDHATLLIDAGDICDGTPFSTEYHGDADMAVMNALGYDVACPGNHEYSNPLSQVRKLIAESRFPLISANSTVKADGTLLYQPYVIKDVQGAKIAFLGLLTYDARTYNAAKTDLVMEEPIETAKRLVPELRKKADMVIAVTHIGVDEDIKMAAIVPGIDVIVGGHSHTLLPEPLLVPHPSDVSLHSVHGTVIVQDFQWAGTLGRLDLNLHRDADGTWHVARYKGRLLPVTSETPEDPQVGKVVAGYWDPIKGKYGEVVGEAQGDFASKGPDHAEYNLVADAIREQMGVDFDIENMGGVRSPLAKGPITYADMVNMDPFGNTIITFRATGRQIKEMLAQDRPAVSGLRYTYAKGALTEATISGKPIEDDKIYTGATNNYYARTLLKDITDKTDTRTPRLETVIAYIRAHKTIQPFYDGRRVLTGIGDFD